MIITLVAHSPKQGINQDTALSSQILPIAPSFNNVIIHDDIDVCIIEGNKNEIIVKNEETANLIKFKVKDSALVIKCKGSGTGRKRPKVIVMVKMLSGISIIGDSEVSTIGELSNIKLELDIYGDGSIIVCTKASEVNTLIKGLGKIEVKGNFQNTSVSKDAWGNMVTTYK